MKEGVVLKDVDETDLLAKAKDHKPQLPRLVCTSNAKITYDEFYFGSLFTMNYLWKNLK